MLKNLMKRLLFGSGCALLMVFMTVAIGQARVPNPIGTPGDCLECHQEIVNHWQDSAHGNAATDPVFLAAWRKAGEPQECMSCHTTFDPETGERDGAGITCTQCHSLGEYSPSHPEQVMLTDTSARHCGSCHVETHNEWQVSEHGKENMTCNKCHNPHSASVKNADVEALCATCHTEEGHFFAFTGHAGEGLTCTDCHLRVSDGPVGEGHSQRVHTFAVDLRTCNDCHKQEMHMPMIGETAVSTTSAATEGPVCALDEAQDLAYPTTGAVAEQPADGSSFNFVLLAGVIGLAFGAVGSPWVERRLRREENQ